LIAGQASRVVTVEMPNAAVDLDTPQDLERFVAGASPRRAGAVGS
jgi:hypothetical protein